MTIHIDLTGCLPDNTTLPINENLPAYLVFPPCLPPPRRPVASGPPPLTGFWHVSVLPCFPAARRSHRMRRHHHHHQHHHQHRHHKSRKERRKHKKHPAEDWEKEEGNFCWRTRHKKAQPPSHTSLGAFTWGDRAQRETRGSGSPWTPNHTPPLYLPTCKKFLSPPPYIHKVLLAGAAMCLESQF